MKILGLIVSLCFAPVAFAQSAAHPQAGTAAAAAQAQQSQSGQAATTEKSSASGQDAAAKSSTGVSPEKEAAIRKLMDVTGMRENMQKVLGGSVENIRPVLRKGLPPGEYQEKLLDLFFERFQQKMKIDDMLDMVVPIYDKHFSMEDIDGLTKFYQSPLGKKAISQMAQVMLECQAVGAKYGEKAGQEAMIEVLGEHPELKKALEEAAAQKN